MPYELIIPVQIGQPRTLTLNDQRALHAILLGAWQQADPHLSEAIHEAHIKPFTQGLLMIEGRLKWRITLLDDALFAPLKRGLQTLTAPRIQQTPLTLDLDRATTHHIPYTDLAQTPAQSRYDFQFLTPTTFKKRNRHDPIPTPYHCCKSWWSRWHQFAPPEHQINIAVLDIAQTHLVISRFNIRSQMWSDKKRRVVGAVGIMNFLPIQQHKLPDPWWQQIATLAAFAPFCGTGHKTTQGLGQTSRRTTSAGRKSKLEGDRLLEESERFAHYL